MAGSGQTTEEGVQVEPGTGSSLTVPGRWGKGNRETIESFKLGIMIRQVGWVH